jgi:hypothetical protein
MRHAEPEIVISLSPRALPLYVFYSVVRIGLAYLISLFFAVNYEYVAAHSHHLEPLMVAGLDICQSILKRDACHDGSVPDATDWCRDGSGRNGQDQSRKLSPHDWSQLYSI